MGISSSKNTNDILSHNEQVLKCVSYGPPRHTAIQNFYCIDEHQYELNFNINNDTCQIVRVNNFDYDNILSNSNILKTPAKILKYEHEFPKIQKQAVIYENQTIKYVPPDIDKYDYYLYNKKLYKTKIDSRLIIMIKNTQLIEQYIKFVWEIFKNNYYKHEIPNVKFIKLKILNSNAHTILQLLKENSSVNITIVPKLVIINDKCILTFFLKSIDDKIDNIPLAKEIIIIDNVKIFD